MTFTTKEIANYISDNLGIPMHESQRLVKSTLEIIKDDLANGNEVMISGFGKWSVKKKGQRKGRNPQTGEEIVIEARKVVTFKPSVKLRDKKRR